MREFYLVRHGQAHSGPSQMDRDFYLTDVGRSQVEALAALLSGWKVQPRQIYASRLTRARQTAEILQRRLGGEIVMRRDLIEHGSEALLFDGSILEAAQRYPRALTPQGQLISGGPGADGLGLTDDFSVGGETLAQLHERARRAWQDIGAQSAEEDGQYLVVAHGSFLSAMVTELLGMPRRSVWGVQFPNAGFVHVRLCRNQRTGQIEPALCGHGPEGPAPVQSDRSEKIVQGNGPKEVAV